MNIRLFKPSLGQQELDNIKDAFDRSWIGLGPKVNEFEEKWANKLDKISQSQLQNELDRLEERKQKALQKAEELGAEEADIKEYFEQKKADTEEKYAEKKRKPVSISIK